MIKKHCIFIFPQTQSYQIKNIKKTLYPTHKHLFFKLFFIVILFDKVYLFVDHTPKGSYLSKFRQTLVTLKWTNGEGL